MIAVVDASVALKWFLQEADTNQALQLRERHLSGGMLLVAPDLLLYEVGNTLQFKRDFSVSDIQAALSDVLRIQLELVSPTERLLHQAADLAHRSKLTYYDSLYLAVANELGVKLITADRRLQVAAGNMVLVELVREAEAL
jgi:predicted nucleic acid-binding protein